MLTIAQILGGLAMTVGSYALFGPWWTMLVFGLATLLASSVAEGVQSRAAHPDQLNRAKSAKREVD